LKSYARTPCRKEKITDASDSAKVKDAPDLQGQNENRDTSCRLIILSVHKI
jgi:hypothetical protein